MKISVVIPTLNESDSITNTLKPLQAWRKRGHQVVLVDGGSTDDTANKAELLVDLVLHSEQGRALQMNTGAERAEGDVLLFLHADTIIADNADQLILNALNDRPWGRFNVAFSSSRFVFKIIAFLMNLKSCLSSVATGDQAIFVSKKLFEDVGRFPQQLLMEDIELSVALRRHARSVCLSQKVITSSRRWEKNGLIKTVLLMWLLRFAYFSGVSSTTLKRWYH
ncbi:MAG: TIGR04283 family arsenosugar biosynthesis glycosyltransferase [Gammaproteobacteria bacterium]|nr:TIGR04283 family arsenosugar biosynthesis glycosyltransferase [Gammaproteobacteria bacterium]